MQCARASHTGDDLQRCDGASQLLSLPSAWVLAVAGPMGSRWCCSRYFHPLAASSCLISVKMCTDKSMRSRAFAETHRIHAHVTNIPTRARQLISKLRPAQSRASVESPRRRQQQRQQKHAQRHFAVRQLTVEWRPQVHSLPRWCRRLAQVRASLPG